MATCMKNFGANPAPINTSKQEPNCCRLIHFVCPNILNDDKKLVADETWTNIQQEAISDIKQEPILYKYYYNIILSHPTLESSLSSYLAQKLSNTDIIPYDLLQELFSETFAKDREISKAVRADLKAVRERDPACSKMLHCFLHYKGFLALQTQRIAHRLWLDGRTAAALLLQSRVSEVFAVDIHPAAKIGSGLLLDHATGVVIGETAVVGHDVSILHGVTLGGTGKESGDRHPKLGDGVLVGAGAKILGNVIIGEGAKIGAGSVVLKSVPSMTTAVGNPARFVGGKDQQKPLRSLDSKPALTIDHTSWSNL